MWFFNKKKKTLQDIANINRLDPHGRAAWATIDSLGWNGTEDTGIHFGFAQNHILTIHEPAWFKKNRSTTVGGEIGPVMYSSPNRHTLVCAPTRAGKTAGILIPTLLNYQHSVLAIDPKGELAAVTAARRQAIGQKVIVLNPWNLHPQALSPFGLHSFNPLDLIDVNDPNAVSNAMLLSSLLVVHGSDQDDFWNQSAAGLITGLILYVAANEAPATRTLSTLRRLLTQSEAALNQLFADMGASTLFGGSIAETGNSFLDMAEKTRSSVLATARTQTDFLRDMVIKNALEKSTFSLAALKETPSTVYLVIPPDQLTVHGRWLRLMVGAAIKVFQSEPRPKHRCLFMLEEFPALGPMSAIETGVATLAGYGVDFLFAIQNLGQMEKLYKQGADTFLANSGFKYFTAINDLETAKYVSSILGTQTITVHSQSGENTSSHLSSRPLELPEELMATGAGQGFLLRPSGDPIRIKPRLYHQDQQLSRLVAANPFHHITEKALSDFPADEPLKPSSPSTPLKAPPAPLPNQRIEDPSRIVFQGLVAFLPFVEQDMRRLGHSALTAALGEHRELFLKLHRMRSVAFLPPDEANELSELLTKASKAYKNADVEKRESPVLIAQLVRISEYLAAEALNRNMFGKIQEKALSDFLDILASEGSPVPTSNPVPQEPIQPGVSQPEPKSTKTSGLPKPYKKPRPGAEAATKQRTPSHIPPLGFSDSTPLCTVKEYLIELLSVIEEDLTNGTFRADHGELRQLLAAAVPAFLDALSGDKSIGILSHFQAFLESLSDIYAKEIRKHPQYPNVLFSSTIEKYRAVKYITQRTGRTVLRLSLEEFVTQGDINFFNSTLTLP